MFGFLGCFQSAAFLHEKLVQVHLNLAEDKNRSHALFGKTHFLKHTVLFFVLSNLRDTSQKLLIYIINSQVKKFEKAVEEDEAVVYRGSVGAPKILADIAESVAAAIYVDIGFDLQRLWMVSPSSHASFSYMIY